MKIILIIIRRGYDKMDRNRVTSLTPAVLLLAVLCFPIALHAAAGGMVELRFDNHRFRPQTFEVRAGQPLALRVLNASGEVIEFESFKLNREKVVPPGESITVRLPALSPGSYDFYDDFHQDVPEGLIVAK